MEVRTKTDNKYAHFKIHFFEQKKNLLEEKYFFSFLDVMRIEN
jgi:hypothetical protein